MEGRLSLISMFNSTRTANFNLIWSSGHSISLERCLALSTIKKRNEDSIDKKSIESIKGKIKRKNIIRKWHSCTFHYPWFHTVHLILMKTLLLFIFCTLHLLELESTSLLLFPKICTYGWSELTPSSKCLWNWSTLLFPSGCLCAEMTGPESVLIFALEFLVGKILSGCPNFHRTFAPTTVG